MAEQANDEEAKKMNIYEDDAKLKRGATIIPMREKSLKRKATLGKIFNLKEKGLLPPLQNIPNINVVEPRDKVKDGEFKPELDESGLPLF